MHRARTQTGQRARVGVPRAVAGNGSGSCNTGTAVRLFRCLRQESPGGRWFGRSPSLFGRAQGSRWEAPRRAQSHSVRSKRSHTPSSAYRLQAKCRWPVQPTSVSGRWGPSGWWLCEKGVAPHRLHSLCLLPHRRSCRVKERQRKMNALCTLSRRSRMRRTEYEEMKLKEKEKLELG